MRKTLLMGALAAMAMLAFVPVSSAGAVELNGGWAPHNRCPVDDPGMLGGSTPACVAASAASGTFKLGKQTVATGATNLQFGVDIGAGGLPFNPLFPGTGGAIQADPVEVPGGLLGLACGGNNNNAAVNALCNTIKGVTDPLNKVTATVESAGPPADFNSLAALLGGPILTLPVKIHLSNPLLGGKCYIGSDADPIVLHPEGVGDPTFDFFSFDPDGTTNPSGDYAQIVLTGTQQDDSFAAPKAQGCGLMIPLTNKHLLDGAVNNKVGLPSPSGNNLLVLDDAVSNVTGSNVGVDGQTFSDDWHSAVLP